MNLLHSYINGNTKVSIYDDGTKVREFEGVAKPVHFESADVKITDYCDGNCLYCHEKSSPQGAHADLERLLEELSGLPAGIELAVGGGSVLSHPQLIPFLTEVKSKGWIANTTINERHVYAGKELLKSLLLDKFIYGLGISYSNHKYLNDIGYLLDNTNNLVFHVIMGLNSVEVIEELSRFCDSRNKECKILILGYKDYGNGRDYYTNHKDDIDANRLHWYRHLASYFKRPGLTLSFDNLAIQQLNLRRFFTDNAWERFYMGKEGSASCFIDAVKQQYAICSVDPNRVSFDDTTLFKFFQDIPEQPY